METISKAPHESIFCGRPSLNNFQASSWSKMKNYYDPTVTEEAARLMLEVADKYRGNNNFEYDLVDIVRQSLSDKGRIVYNRTIADFKSFDKCSFARDSRKFLDILLLQDKLLGTRSEFRVGRWIEQARKLGTTPEEKDLYEWNARVQITTRAIVFVLTTAVCVTMPIRNGTAFCAIFTINVGRLIGKPSKTNWMVNPK